MKIIKVGFKNNALWIVDKISHGEAYADGLIHNVVLEMTQEEFDFLRGFIVAHEYDEKASITKIDHLILKDWIVDYSVYLYKDSSIKKVNPIKDQQVLNFKWDKGVKKVFPAHQMISNWLFGENTEEEAALAHYMAVVAEKSGMGQNDLQHLFPAVLRMLKNDTVWSGVSKK